MNKFYLIIILLLFSCRKELDIAEFSFNYEGYQPELRVEALILPHDSTAIVRIDKSYLINDVALYDCRDNDYGSISKEECELIEGAIWHGTTDDIIADCGDWNPFIHDIGSDGIASKDNNLNGNYDDFGDTAPDIDGTENNGIPDCNEPNVDDFSEILPYVHTSSCQVSIYKNNMDKCDLIFDKNGGHFFNELYTGSRTTPIFDNIETINYGAYVPSAECDKIFWIDYSAEYSFTADCSNSEYPVLIQSKDPIKLSRPVVYFLPEDSLEIIKCTNYDCLMSNSSISDFNSDSLLYFARYSFGTNLNYVSILPTLTYQAVQYMYDNENDQYVYYHGHPAVGTNMLNIVDSVSVMIESVVSEPYDGYGNNQWDAAEIRTENQNDCSGFFIQDFQGGYCDSNENGRWDDKELFSDDNQNGIWDDGEYFIDTADDFPEVDKYYYEIFTFSDSYNKYYFNDQLFLDDVERTNLREIDGYTNNGNPILGTTVLGAFGSMTSEKIYFQIIDCTVQLGQDNCENVDLTKSVCEWKENISLSPCINYEGPICIPKGFSTEYCE